jgi:hypothetical protein
LINRLVDNKAHLMIDKSRSHQALAKSYAAHDYVNHGIKEFVRGDAHVNTTESFGALLERTKQGVFHYLSEPHLPRYLDEISFRWNHRIPDKEIIKRGKRKLIYKPMPVMTPRKYVNVIPRAFITPCRILHKIYCFPPQTRHNFGRNSSGI